MGFGNLNIFVLISFVWSLTGCVGEGFQPITSDSKRFGQASQNDATTTSSTSSSTTTTISSTSTTTTSSTSTTTSSTSTTTSSTSTTTSSTSTTTSSTSTTTSSTSTTTTTSSTSSSTTTTLPQRVQVSAATLIGGPGFGGHALGRESLRHCKVSQAPNSPKDLILSGSGVDQTPTTQGAYSQVFKGGSALGGDSWIGRMSLDLTQLTAATFFGGSGEEREAYNFDEFSNGDIVFGGSTMSGDLPTTNGAFETTLMGSGSSGYAARMSSDLSRVIASTYIDNGNNSSVRGHIEIDHNENVIFAGGTGSAFSRLSFNSNAIQQYSAGGYNEAWILKLDSNLSQLNWGTFLGGGDTSPTEVVIATQQVSPTEIVIVGSSSDPNFINLHKTSGPQPSPHGDTDLYVASINTATTPNTFNWFVLVGRNNQTPLGFDDPKNGIAIDSSGNVYFVGVASSSMGTSGAFQTNHGGVEDCIVGKVNASTRSIEWITMLGGSGIDSCLAPKLDKDGNIIISGRTNSPNFPTTSDAHQRALGGGYDAFLAMISSDGSQLLFSTLYGGSSDEYFRWNCEDASTGSIYAVGWSRSSDFETTSGVYQERYSGGGEDMAVVKFTGFNFK